MGGGGRKPRVFLRLRPAVGGWVRGVGADALFSRVAFFSTKRWVKVDFSVFFGACQEQKYCNLQRFCVSGMEKVYLARC